MTDSQIGYISKRLDSIGEYTKGYQVLKRDWGGRDVCMLVYYKIIVLRALLGIKQLDIDISTHSKFDYSFSGSCDEQLDQVSLLGELKPIDYDMNLGDVLPGLSLSVIREDLKESVPYMYSFYNELYPDNSDCEDEALELSDAEVFDVLFDDIIEPGMCSAKNAYNGEYISANVICEISKNASVEFHFGYEVCYSCLWYYFFRLDSINPSLHKKIQSEDSVVFNLLYGLMDRIVDYGMLVCAYDACGLRPVLLFNDEKRVACLVYHYGTYYEWSIDLDYDSDYFIFECMHYINSLIFHLDGKYHFIPENAKL